MDELITPLWRVKLDDPIDVWYVDASRCKVCCQEQCTSSTSFSVNFSFSELFVYLCSFLLIYFPMQFAHEVDLLLLFKDHFQRRVMEVDGCASAEEDNDPLVFHQCIVYEIDQCSNLFLLGYDSGEIILQASRQFTDLVYFLGFKCIALGIYLVVKAHDNGIISCTRCEKMVAII